MLLVTANGGSNDVTLFNFQAGALSEGQSYPLPEGAHNPVSIAASSNGAYLATANSDSNSFTLFPLKDGTLGKGTSYSLPQNSTHCVSISFAPNNGSNGAQHIATANAESADVTVGTLLTGNSDGSSNDDVTIIVATTVTGGVVGGASLVIAASIATFLLYKYVCRPRASLGSVNYGPEGL